MSARPFPEDLRHQAENIIKNYPEKRAALLPILHLFQERDAHIADWVAETVAEFLGLPLIKVQEVLSFYTLYTKRPRGKRHFQICRTLSCSLLGGEMLGEHLEKKWGTKAGEVSPDGKFSYELVECLGACEMAPMMCVDKLYVGSVTPAVLDTFLKEKR